MCRSKNAGVAGYAEAFRPVQSDSQTSEWYSYFENDVLVLKAHVYVVWIGLAETRTKASAGKTPGVHSRKEKENFMFTTRLISGIVLVILAIFFVGKGGGLLFAVTALISLVAF